MLKKNDRYTAEIENMTPDGYGICRIDGRAAFVSGAMEGEIWEILILKVTASVVWAKGVTLLQASEQRRKPDCPNPCGGCTLRHLSYDCETEVKRSYVESCLRRIGGIERETSCIHPSPEIERYRNKAIFAVDTVDDRTAFGFYRPRSHNLVPVKDCLLQSEECICAARAVTEFMNERGLSPYDEATGKGTVRHLFWRESRQGDRVLCIVTARGFGSATPLLIEWLRSQVPSLTGLVLCVNKRKGNTVLSGEFHTLWGNPDVRETLCGNVFEVALQAFLQINPPQAEALYARALALAGTGKLCLDLYCGAGTVTLALAHQFERVVGAEIVPEAVENARASAENNGVRNAEFVCADAAEVAEMGLQPDVVVVDPPRKGLAESVIRDIARMEPDRVVYISCSPATLARDLKFFADEGYTVDIAEAFDMFPRTAHVETVVLLTRNT